MSRTKARSNVVDAITLPLSGASFSDVVTMDATKIINLLNPVLDQDAATKQYVDDQIVAVIVPLLDKLVPPGVIIPWGKTTPPANWGLCDGASYDSIADSTLTTLFTNIGTTFGGTGSDDFNVPDLLGRIPLGQYYGGAVGNRADSVSAQTMGGISGAGTVFLNPTELPVHSHTGTTNTKGGHSHSGSTGPAGNHTHDVRARNHCVDGSGSANLLSWIIQNGQGPKANLIETVPNHSHTITGINAEPNHTHPFTTDSDGGAADHENTPPFQTVNYIIKLV